MRKRRESGGNRTRLVEISSDGFTTANRAEKRRTSRGRRADQEGDRTREPKGDETDDGIVSRLRRLLGLDGREAA